MAIPQNVTVFGATGGLGAALVTELAQRGHQVTGVSRTITAQDVPDGVRTSQADLADVTDTAAATRAAEGADVVVMAAALPYTQWATGLQPLVEGAVRAAESVGARLVVADNLYPYGSPGRPIAADSPETTTTRKGAIRRDIGRWLLDEHARGRASITIGRFSDYYGPGGVNSVVQQVIIGPAVAGKRARAFIADDQLHSFHYLPDAARGFASLVERPDADGAAWVLPAAPPITQGGFIGLVEDVLGTPVKTGLVTPTMLRFAGLFNSQMREVREMTGQFDRPYTIDADAFEQRFGPIELTAHRDALAETIRWTRLTAAA